jgi:hypothetical protein
MLKEIIRKGKVVADFETVGSIRERVIRELGEVSRGEPALAWG